jgi:AraC family transcriptional regulator
VLGRRIVVSAEGRIRPPLFPKPFLSSAGLPWTGFLVEQHFMPSHVQFPPCMKFPGHLLGLSLSEQPPPISYREDGRHRRRSIPNGAIAMRSSQDLIDCEQEGSCTLFSLLISDAKMNSVCQDLPTRGQIELVPAPDVIDPTLRVLMETLIKDLKAGSPSGRIFGESLTDRIAALATANHSVFRFRLPEYRTGLPRHTLLRLIDYIHANLNSDLTVEQLAQVALMSPFHCGKLFKNSTGKTFHQYVLDERIKSAKVLLEHSNLPLVEIGATVGLPNQTHFTTVFRKKVGATPGFYRDQVRGQRR